MVNNVGFINIRVILDRLLRHPLLTDLNLETAIQYSVDFIGIMGLPKVYVDKIETVEIENYRGMLPCDLVAIEQVRMHNNGVVLRGMTDNFNTLSSRGSSQRNIHNKAELTFKTQGRVIYTSFQEGSVDISYRAMMLDEEGLPLLPDNSVFLKALEMYIKKEWFTILFDLGKLNNQVLQNTQQEYAFRAAQCNNEFVIPSVSEMESISSILNQMIPRVNEFNKSFKPLGDKEYLRVH